MPKRFTDGTMYVIGAQDPMTTFTLTTLTTKKTTILILIDNVKCGYGYQNRRALRGSHRGIRCPESEQRRFASQKSKQQSSRRDYRQWKSNFKDSTLRSHCDQNPKPLKCPTTAALNRLQSQPRRCSKGSNQLRKKQYRPLSLRALTYVWLLGM